jgi:SAM-dependent methyltransferase
MKSQADVFPRVAYEIEQMGGKIDVYGSGLLPDRWRGERSKSIEQRETEKYQAIWNYSSYRDRSPATEHVVKAILSMGVEPGDTLVDFGCGTGRATKLLIDNGVNAIGVDIAPNALENDIPFTQSLLWNLPDEIVFRNSKFGLCCDVMEHIPTEKVSEVLSNIAQSVMEAVYFTIDDDLDEMGVLIGATLHLTVKPEAWWKGQLFAHFNRVETPEKGVFICWK